MKRLYLDIAAYSDKPIDKHGDYVSAESEYSNILLLDMPLTMRTLV